MKNEQPLIIPIPDIERDTYLYENTQDHCVYFEVNGIKYKALVKKGFRFDGVSSPLILSPIIKVTRDGLERCGGMTHDNLYQTGGILDELYSFTVDDTWMKSDVIFSRKESDQILRDIIITTPNVSSEKAVVIYAGVRLGGWIPWNGHKNKFSIDRTGLHTDLSTEEVTAHLKTIHDYNLSQILN